MAGALVSQAFVNSLIQVVFERLASPEFASFIRGKKLNNKLLQRLVTNLYAVQTVLNDAEQRQIKDPAVKKWLDDLKDAVYDADDLLDRVSTEAATTQKEVSTLFSRFLNFRESEVVTKLEDINERLESAGKNKDILGLKGNARENLLWRTPSTSLLERSTIYGRDQDKEAIMELLLDDTNTDATDAVSVIPIVGMGGVGKSTLAQQLYNDESLEQRFDLKMWVCVSHEFDVQKITKALIEAINSSSCNMKGLDFLQLELKEKLIGKKYLLVLDDVWNEHYGDWSDFLKPLEYGAKGSKILVTTRSTKVASVVQTCRPYQLSLLSDADCWLVFAHHSCLPLESGEDSIKKKIGRQIADKCKGLPLAAKTLGGLLRRQDDIRNWKAIMQSEIWELSDNESKIIPALRISYHYLPPYLKPCFAYCSLFPKNYKFDKDELVLLWMAEDFLQSPKTGKTLEDIGLEYFDELTSTSCFQLSSIDGDCFVMHDLMHDLAVSVAGEFHFRLEGSEKANRIGARTRHLSYSKSIYHISRKLQAFGGAQHLRTFFPICSNVVPFNNDMELLIILPMLKSLRVLSFCSFQNLVEVPDSIGELIQLRYLDLSRTKIKSLPESLGNLYNLQTLKLYFCDHLRRLPSSIQNLVNLRHLDVTESSLVETPKGISKLQNLQFLTDFVASEGNSIAELGGLPNIHGRLGITHIQNVRNSSEASEARMMEKKHISPLFYGWDYHSEVSSSQQERDIFDKLQPHTNVNTLWICGYRGTTFPDWLSHSSYNNIATIALNFCRNCCMLPSLGQLPNLKSLTITNFPVLQKVGGEFYRSDNLCSATPPFPSLEHLEFDNMPCWQEWDSFDPSAFPQLKYLELRDCPRLSKGLPDHLPVLKTLSIRGCQKLVSSLPRAPVTHIVISESNCLVLQDLPLSLNSLSLSGSQVVQSMFKVIANMVPTCLKSLSISDCWFAVSFPGDCLPASLKSLHIKNCRRLELPNQQHQFLEVLSIINSCDSLTSLSPEMFPNLTKLDFTKCHNLESLTVSYDAALQNLKTLTIDDCRRFAFFGRERITVAGKNCSLPKLQNLTIKHCPRLDLFPIRELVPNLRSLNITNCVKLLSLVTSEEFHPQGLLHLIIGGDCDRLKSFPMEGTLPASLMHLELNGLLSLETLDCKGLVGLTSLQQLIIADCPKLENLDGERLPACLSQLYIYYSPSMEKLYREKDSRIWPKMSHIPEIRTIVHRIAD
ncbi:hypothetical protein PIB30_026256 [Stylosanthes scabra]|uniref:Disease resistance RPP13-like protein 1 n=1 Tax=Stylosanthes scabra TaxID=79078 RepID=A0ABU6SAD2_9FABA|nr:hypothetical protein [Stylosanthes scabra]